MTDESWDREDADEAEEEEGAEFDPLRMASDTRDSIVGLIASSPRQAFGFAAAIIGSSFSLWITGAGEGLRGIYPVPFYASVAALLAFQAWALWNAGLASRRTIRLFFDGEDSDQAPGKGSADHQFAMMQFSLYNVYFVKSVKQTINLNGALVMAGFVVGLTGSPGALANFLIVLLTIALLLPTRSRMERWVRPKVAARLEWATPPGFME